MQEAVLIVVAASACSRASPRRRRSGRSTRRRSRPASPSTRSSPSGADLGGRVPPATGDVYGSAGALVPLLHGCGGGERARAAGRLRPRGRRRAPPGRVAAVAGDPTHDVSGPIAAPGVPASAPRRWRYRSSFCPGRRGSRSARSRAASRSSVAWISSSPTKGCSRAVRCFSSPGVWGPRSIRTQSTATSSSVRPRASSKSCRYRGAAPRPTRESRPSAAGEPLERVVDLVLVVRDNGVAVRRLIAGETKGVQRRGYWSGVVRCFSSRHRARGAPQGRRPRTKRTT